MQAPDDAPAAQPAALAAGGRIVAGSCDIALAGQQLEHIPADVWHDALASLDVSANRLAQWPLPSTALPALRQIDLSCNPGIASVPAGAFACCAASLQHLDVSGELLFPRQLAITVHASLQAKESIAAGWAQVTIYATSAASKLGLLQLQLPSSICQPAQYICDRYT